MEHKNPKFPNKYLIIGVLFIIMGCPLLLWTLGILPGFSKLWPVPLIIGGMLCLYLAFLKGKTDILIVPGMFFTLGGIVFLLINTFLTVSSMEKIWPVFMLITGGSLIPFAYKKRTKSRIAIIIPAVVIIVLSLVFLPFSLDISPISFDKFVTRWWPAILLITGGFFISSHIYKLKKKHKNEEHDDDYDDDDEHADY